MPELYKIGMIDRSYAYFTVRAESKAEAEEKAYQKYIDGMVNWDDSEVEVTVEQEVEED